MYFKKYTVFVHGSIDRRQGNKKRKRNRVIVKYIIMFILSSRKKEDSTEKSQVSLSGTNLVVRKINPG